MVNYANGKIYKIESILGDKIYIGSSTKEQLSMRMSSHRSDYKKWKNGKAKMTTSFQLFDEYGLENCSIVLIEDCPCETKDQLSAREAHYINTLTCVNKVVPLRTTKEYEQDNKEAISAKKKAYREENKEQIATRMKAYREVNRDEINAKNRDYENENREKVRARQKVFREANREMLAKKTRAYREAKKITPM